MYNDLKIASLKRTKKGSFATSASVLEDLAFKGNEFPKQKVGNMCHIFF